MSYLAGDTSDTATATDADNEIPSVRLPSKYLPGFWPSMALGVCAVLHALYVLLQVWSVDFRCRVGFSETENVLQATHAYVKPQKHAGKLELVPMQISEGGLGHFFEFQRRMCVQLLYTDLAFVILMGFNQVLVLNSRTNVCQSSLPYKPGIGAHPRIRGRPERGDSQATHIVAWKEQVRCCSFVE